MMKSYLLTAVFPITRQVKKVKVTDHEKVIINKYGANYYRGRDMGMGDYIEYVDRISKRCLRFWLEEGKVREIEFKKI